MNDVAQLTLKPNGGLEQVTFELRNGRQRTFRVGKPTSVPRDLVTAFLKTGQIVFFDQAAPSKQYVYCRDVKGWVRIEDGDAWCPECETDIGVESHVLARIPDSWIKHEVTADA